ncbi:MAG: SDR family NAD(P)-dependent oxidoreductase, partial [Parvularculaceae bacterium]|nr:SDR family NAD(P)-dependent oxidoreductase [Parvularculaceae bacterium]
MKFAERYGPFAVVAGASEGTGAAFVRGLARRGVPSLLVARRKEPLETLAAEIAAETGLHCPTLSLDLSDPDATGKIAAAVGGREVGLYVANAGADPNSAHFLDQYIAAWTAYIQRNVMTLMACCHHFGGAMRARGRGGLLIVNSGACYGGGSYMAAYSASRAFALMFGESLWSELKPSGVDVLNCVMTLTDTPALRRLLDRNGLPVPSVAASADAVAEAALDRLGDGPVFNWGQADDVAGFAVNTPAER